MTGTPFERSMHACVVLYRSHNRGGPDMHLRTFAGVLLCGLLVLVNSTYGQETKGAIKIMVGLPAGSAADAAARALADSFKDSLGQTVIVDNRPGAGGRIAAELLKRSPPD